jgi:dipeptidyl aminopeptidase/acylaminoacyl peptidase
VAYKPDAGVVEEKVEKQRIAVLDLAAGRVRRVSPEGLYVYDYDWSPDGKTFAAEAVEGSGTNDYWIAELYAVPAGGGPARSLWKPPLQIAVPRFSPDGKTIAVIHGLMSDEGSNGGDVWEVPLSGASLAT